MTAHSLAEAQMQLSSLIDRAIAGEDVVITRDGAPVVVLRPVPAAAPKMPLDESIEWLRAQRIGSVLGPGEDAGEIVGRLRDDENAK